MDEDAADITEEQPENPEENDNEDLPKNNEDIDKGRVFLSEFCVICIRRFN